MAYLTVQEILGASDLVSEDFPVEKWGGVLKLRSLTAEEATNISVQSRRPNGSIDTKKSLFLTFMHGVVEPVFDANVYEALMHKDGGTVLRVVKEIQRLSGLDLTVEEQEKNLVGSLS